MATLEKIRSKGILLLVVVGFALAAFILGDLLNSGSTYFNESHANVAEINGEKIKIRDYAQKMEEFNNVVKLTYGSNIDDEMSEQIRQMVWESTVREKVIGDECANIGMQVTTEELKDMIVGSHISDIIRNNGMFVDANGVFDVNMVKQFLVQIDSEEFASQVPYDQLNGIRNYWKYVEHSVKENRLDEKYNKLLASAMVINHLEAKYAYNKSKTSGDAVYAMKNYFAVADSAVSVSEAEIKKLYNKKKEQFKIDAPSADIRYIAIAVKPSEEDFEDANRWIENLKDEFATTTDIAGLTNANSDEPYRAENLTEEQVDEDFREFAFNGKADDVMGPIFVDNTFKMARIVESGIIAPDSVKISHILLASEKIEKTQALADSIQNAVKKGASFAEMAQQHSLAQQTAMNGGEIGWVSESGLDAQIARQAFSSPAKSMFQIKEGNSINIFYIEETGKKVEKVKLAVLSRSVDASSRTRTNIYNKAKQYVVDNNTLDMFKANADSLGYRLELASNVNINASAINNIKRAREIVRWAFENKVGAVSDVFEIDDKIIMASVEKRVEKGYRPIDEVRNMLAAELRKEKKGDIIVAEAQGKTIAELTTQGFRMDTVRNISFASNYAGSIGNEPILFAHVANTELNQQSAPVKGNGGVYVYTIINKTENPREYNEKEEAVMLSTRESYSIPQLSYKALKDAANIEDMRYKYY